MIEGFYGVVSSPELVPRLVAGGARVIQVRMKDATAAALVKVCREVRKLTRAAGVLMIVNDRLDVALATGADGVHLGQDDLPLAAARAVAGKLIIGISTHDVEQARAAARAGADYLGFGPVFATSTKQNPDPVQGVDMLAAAVRAAAPVPVVAIGGITVAQARDVARAGARAICAIASVNNAPDVIAAARQIAGAWT